MNKDKPLGKSTKVSAIKNFNNFLICIKQNFKWHPKLKTNLNFKLLKLLKILLQIGLKKVKEPFFRLKVKQKR